MKAIALRVSIFASLSIGSAALWAQQPFPNVASPQANPVFTESDIRSLAKQEQSLSDIKDQLKVIQNSIEEVSTDVKSLKETQIIAKFIANVFLILIPGLLITAFGVWLTLRLQRRMNGRMSGGLETS